MMSDYEKLIAKLGKALNMPDMAPDEDGYLMLKVDDQFVHMQLDAEADEIILYAILQEVEPDRQLEIYARLLTANTFWKETGGATLSIDEASGRVLLGRVLPLRSLDEVEFDVALGRFTDTVTHWEGWLEAANAGGEIYAHERLAGMGIRPAALGTA
ncbi:type III secretion system chaperone [Achromobacter marplatensis]|uniref:type III secretion system chaperone n=1 Tax=Achromobacter marplatensis TaxID=470868 RepID=UPI0039F73E3A